MTMNRKPLKENIDSLESVLDHAQAIWEARGEKTDIKGLLKEQTIEKADQGFVVYDKEEPVGFVAFTRSSPYYAGATIHGKTEAADKYLIQTILEEKLLEDTLVELGSLKVQTVYKKHLESVPNIIINERQRMALWLDEHHIFRVEAPSLEGVTFHQMGEGFEVLCGELSFEAHKVSKDYYMNPEMNNLALRIELEKQIQKGKKIEFDPTASAIAVYQNMLIGFCTVAYIECWGYKKVPWIFDLSVHPNYHKKGIGRELIKSVINGLTQRGYPIMGLSVTQNNSAKELYEKLGFLKADDFYEYLIPVNWSIPYVDA